MFTPLPTGEGHFYVFYYLCHYDFCPLCHYGFCIILSVIVASVLYVIMASAHSVCHCGFCPLCHYGFCIILSVIITSVHYVIMASASFCLSFWLLSIMSLWLLFPCYFVFYILCQICLPFILSDLEGFCVKYFYHLTILSVSCECRVGQYLPFLSRTFREEFVTIKKNNSL